MGAGATDALRVAEGIEAAIAFERLLVIGAAGWIARSDSLAEKCFLCHWVWSGAERVRLLARVLPSERRSGALEAGLDDGARRLVVGVLTAPSGRILRQVLLEEICPVAAAVYVRLAESARGRTVQVARVCARTYRQLVRRRPLRRSYAPTVEEAGYRRRVASLRSASGRWRAVVEGAGWPADEVRGPKRDATIRGQRRGEVRPEEWLSASGDGYEQYLHQMIAFEIAAFETVGRQMADFPRMPWAFHRDMAAQIRDEHSHLLMWLERLRRSGGRLGRFPLCTFEFDLCVGQPLAGRLALLQRIVEGFALEALDLNRLVWESRGDRVMLEYIRRVQLDEIAHVRNGNAWLRWLCSSDEVLAGRVASARAEAEARLLDSARALAASGAVDAGNCERMLAKLEQGKGMPVNVALRRRAGFSVGELRREAAHRGVSLSMGDLGDA